MTDTEIWNSLVAELDRWEHHGKQAHFWLRDDDAVKPTGELDRFLELAGGFAVPLALAVIPKDTGQALARRLDDAPGVSVVLHGWSHENHAPSGEKKQELGLHRGVDVVLEELRVGAARLDGLHGERYTGLLVPPWNRIDPTLLPHLSGLGLAGLSTFGPEQVSPIRSINTHVDLMDWKSRRGREAASLVTDIVNRLRQVFDNGRTIGILTHHLVHDAAAWNFLERLFDLTSRHRACAWLPVNALLSKSR